MCGGCEEGMSEEVKRVRRGRTAPYANFSARSASPALVMAGTSDGTSDGVRPAVRNGPVREFLGSARPPAQAIASTGAGARPAVRCWSRADGLRQLCDYSTTTCEAGHATWAIARGIANTCSNAPSGNPTQTRVCAGLAPASARRPPRAGKDFPQAP